MGLEALKKGFFEGCKQITCLDGCFLKSPYGRQLLCAIRKDGNDQMFPIAFGIVEKENIESWKWFMDTLISD